MTSLTFKLRALTDIWTGTGHDPNQPPPPYFQAASLLGAIRWWAEAIVRAHGAHACDPTARTGDPPAHLPCATPPYCYICNLFGGVGGDTPRAARFAFRCWDRNGAPQKERLKKRDQFNLEFIFYDRDRAVTPGEQYLLAKTIEIIAAYGSLGGKTIFKPANSPAGQAKTHHKDFGLVELPNGLPQGLDMAAGKAALTSELAGSPSPSRGADSLPNLNRFWFVPGHTLYAEHGAGTFNQLIGLNPRPAGDDPYAALRAHVRGSLGANGQSKKVFSFGDPKRTWGYVTDTALWNETTITDWLATVGVTATSIEWGKDKLV